MYQALNFGKHLHMYLSPPMLYIIHILFVFGIYLHLLTRVGIKRAYGGFQNWDTFLNDG